MVKRNAIDNLLVFNKICRFRGNEIFSVEPFIMLGIDAGWSEKFVRIFPDRLVNREWKPWKLEIGNSEIEDRRSKIESPRPWPCSRVS